jgi:hypothetical protein
VRYELAAVWRRDRQNAKGAVKNRKLVLMWLFTTFLQRVFHNSLVLLVLGFISLPLTTILYAWEINNGLPPGGNQSVRAADCRHH